MKSKLFVLSLLTLLLLASCQQQPADVSPTSEEPTPVPAATVATAAATEPAERESAYPAPGEGYPGPETYEQVLTPAYPGASVVDPSSVVTRPPDSALDPEQPVPTPAAGMATVTGHVLSQTTGEPLVNVPVRLAQVYYNEENMGSFILDGARSPGALTDVNGRFILASVEAVEYVVVVGDVETNRYEIIASDGGSEAQVWEMSAGEITDVGTLRVELE